MILWSSKVETETDPKFPHVGRRSWRWVIEAYRWKADVGASVGLYEQVKFGGTPFHPADEEWHSRGRYLDISLTPHFLLGESHDYYDGPHCSFSLGYLHINWSWNWCDKCLADEDSGACEVTA